MDRLPGNNNVLLAARMISREAHLFHNNMILVYMDIILGAFINSQGKFIEINISCEEQILIDLREFNSLT